MLDISLEPHIADDGTVFAQWRVCNRGYLIGYLGHGIRDPLNIIAVYDAGTKDAILEVCRELKREHYPDATIPHWVSPPSDEECKEAFAAEYARAQSEIEAIGGDEDDDD